MKKTRPAIGLLKERSRATRHSPRKEPNIGIRQSVPVMRPKGKASPGEKLKINERIKTKIAVAQALIRPTVRAPET